MHIRRLKQLAAAQANANPPFVMPPGLFVHLSPESALNAAGTEALDGEEVATWSNLITGNAITSAVQSVVADRPTVRYWNGKKEIYFGGANTKSLTFGRPTELGFPTATADFTIVVLNGSGPMDTFWFSTLTASNSSSGPIAMDFYNNRYYVTFGGTWFSTSIPIPNDSAHMVAVQRKAGVGLRAWFDKNNWLDRTVDGNFDGVLDHDFLIGKTNNNTVHHLKGSLRRFMIWNRRLTETELHSIYDHFVAEII